MPATLLISSGFVLIAFILWRYAGKGRYLSLSLPPGPPSDPLIGHLRVAPLKNHAEVYREWSKQYGTRLLLTPSPLTVNVK